MSDTLPPADKYTERYGAGETQMARVMNQWKSDECELLHGVGQPVADHVLHRGRPATATSAKTAASSRGETRLFDQ